MSSRKKLKRQKRAQEAQELRQATHAAQRRGLTAQTRLERRYGPIEQE